MTSIRRLVTSGRRTLDRLGRGTAWSAGTLPWITGATTPRPTAAPMRTLPEPTVPWGALSEPPTIGTEAATRNHIAAARPTLRDGAVVHHLPHAPGPPAAGHRPGGSRTAHSENSGGRSALHDQPGPGPATGAHTSALARAADRRPLGSPSIHVPPRRGSSPGVILDGDDHIESTEVGAGRPAMPRSEHSAPPTGPTHPRRSTTLGFDRRVGPPVPLSPTTASTTSTASAQTAASHPGRPSTSSHSSPAHGRQPAPSGALGELVNRWNGPATLDASRRAVSPAIVPATHTAVAPLPSEHPTIAGAQPAIDTAVAPPPTAAAAAVHDVPTGRLGADDLIDLVADALTEIVRRDIEHHAIGDLT